MLKRDDVIIDPTEQTLDDVNRRCFEEQVSELGCGSSGYHHLGGSWTLHKPRLTEQTAWLLEHTYLPQLPQAS